MLDSRAGARVVSWLSHLPGSTGGRGPMRSTEGGALDPTQANRSASPPPPVRPPLHVASTPVLWATTRFATPSARPHRWRGEIRYPDRAGTLRTSGCPNHRDLHSCPESRRAKRSQPCGDAVMTPFQMGLMPVRITYRGKTTPTEKPMREIATFVHVSPIGHMRVTLTGNPA